MFRPLRKSLPDGTYDISLSWEGKVLVVIRHDGGSCEVGKVGEWVGWLAVDEKWHPCHACHFAIVLAEMLATETVPLHEPRRREFQWSEATAAPPHSHPDGSMGE